MAFIGRVLLNNVRHVQKARVLSAPLCCHRQPVIAVAQARMITKAATTPLHEGKPNGGMSARLCKGFEASVGQACWAKRENW